MASVDELKEERRKVCAAMLSYRQARAALAGTKQYSKMREYSAQLNKLEKRRAELTIEIGDGPR